MIDLSALKSEKLDQAVQEFENKNGKLEQVCPAFVDSFAAWIKKCLQDEDNFPIGLETDAYQAWTPEEKAGEIYNLYSENCVPNDVQQFIDELEAKFHPVMVCDEIDNFIMALIEAIAQADAEGWAI
jgi:hypothetical protein